MNQEKLNDLTIISVEYRRNMYKTWKGLAPPILKLAPPNICILIKLLNSSLIL
jgi:hypothetical protein